MKSNYLTFTLFKKKQVKKSMVNNKSFLALFFYEAHTLCLCVCFFY